MRRFFIFLTVIYFSCSALTDYDVIIRNGLVYDGSGNEPIPADVAIQADTIAAIGDLSQHSAKKEIDANGMAVAPGFINMLSWATESLIEDGRSQSEIRQGVTLEVFGEGWSMGPLNDKMKQESMESQGDIKFDIEWTTLGEYLEEKEIKYLVEETYLFRMWDHYLEGQLSKKYSLVVAKPGRGWYKVGIYKKIK